MGNLKITDTDSKDGMVILNLVEDNGAPHSISLNSMDVASLMGSLRASLEEAIGHPSSESVGLPGMQRVQYVETPDTVYFRVFLSDRLFHEYPVPRDTTLGTELKLFGDRVEARNMAKATHQPPERSN
jgi:hypothetical protein